MTETAPAEPLEEHHYPCPQCGADMRFDPGLQALVCDHCGHTQPVDESAPAPELRELDYEAALAARLPEAEMEETRVTSCPGCGAQIQFPPESHATTCPFCGTPVVLDTGAHRQIKPRGLVPFALDEDAARKAMTDWLGRLWFAPNGLQQYARKGRRMTGIYTPWWTFDADTESRYTGARGDAYYVTRTVMRDGKSSNVRERRIRWTPVSGRVRRFFDDVLVLASKSLPRRYTEGLEPWDLSGLMPYRPDYLAGFGAESYTVGLEEGFGLGRQKMDKVILRDVRFDIGGDAQRVTSVKTSYRDVTFKHVLLPVWTAVYKYRGKTYRFVVNGQTGRVQGERPWSWVKITFAVLLGLIAAAAIGYFIAQNQ